MKVFNSNFQLLLLWVLVILSCKHPSSQLEFIGAAFAPAPKGFKIVDRSFTAAYSNIEFGKDQQFFSATFSDNVQWTIVLQGKTSGARKQLTGIATLLNIQNSVWDGSADNAVVFDAGEEVWATLTVLGDTTKLTCGFIILNVKSRKSFVVEDFETQIFLDSTTSESGNATSVYAKDSLHTMQGKYSCNLKGIDQNQDYWIGSLCSKKIIKLDTIQFHSSDVLGLNLFIYGYGFNASSIELKVYEEDNHIAGYQANQDDIFHAIFPVNWSGWKFVSIPYNDFTLANPATFSGKGLREPAHISRLSLSLLSVPAGGEAGVCVDYIYFSNQ